MSLRLRIRVLRCRQLSATGRFYEALDHGDGGVVAEPPPRVVELSPGPVELAALGSVPGGGQVAQSSRLAVAKTLERVCGRDELVSLEMSLGPPARGAAARFRRRPLLVRVFGHGDDRA